MKKVSNKHLSFYICLILASAAFAVFCQLRTAEFINYDDTEYVTKNQHVRDGLTRESIIWAFTTPHSGISYWHPLTWLSHMLDCELFGLDAGRHHLSSLLLHIANTLLLFLIFKQMTGEVWKSAFVAAAFSLHPLHVESVAWVAERKDVLSTLFWILTMIAYLRYIKHPRVTRYLLTLFIFGLGLMTKPMLVTLPCVLLLLDYWPLDRFERGKVYRLIVEKIPFFVLSAILSIVTFLVQRDVGTVVATDLISPKMRIANAFISYVKYIGKMFWPRDLAILYPHPGYNLSMRQAVAAALLLLIVSVCVVYLLKRHKYLLVGWLWYLGTLFPVIGVVQVGGQAMADRYTYMSLTGLFVIIAWGLDDLLRKWRYRKTVLSTAAVTVLLALSVCTWIQVGLWQNSITIFEHTLKVTSNNSIMHNNLGTAFELQGRLDEAINQYRQSLRIRPNHARTHNNLANALRLQSKFEEATSHFHQALQIKPEYADAHNNLGNLLHTQGNLDEAISHFRQALQIRPDHAEAHNNLGSVLLAQGDLDEALNHFRQALLVRPDLAESHNSLGVLLAAQGKFDEAIGHYRRTLRSKSDWPQPLNDLAWILATHPDPNMRNAKEAVTLAERAAELTNYQNPIILDTLAAAYAAAGKFERAMSITQKALDLAIRAENEKLADYLRKQLELYKQQKR